MKKNLVVSGVARHRDVQLLCSTWSISDLQCCVTATSSICQPTTHVCTTVPLSTVSWQAFTMFGPLVWNSLLDYLHVRLLAGTLSHSAWRCVLYRMQSIGGFTMMHRLTLLSRCRCRYDNRVVTCHSVQQIRLHRGRCVIGRTHTTACQQWLSHHRPRATTPHSAVCTMNIFLWPVYWNVFWIVSKS